MKDQKGNSYRLWIPEEIVKVWSHKKIIRYYDENINLVKLWDWDKKDDPIEDYLIDCIEFNDSKNIYTK